MKHDRMLSLAKQASKKSDHHSHKIGCVISKGSKILGTGWNKLRTHSKSPHKFKSIHAEFMAALNANFDLRGATAYVFRQQKDGKPAIAKPCECCWKFLSSSGVKKVIYSFEGSFRSEHLK